MSTLSILLVQFDALTLRGIITDIPHDVSAAVTYLLIGLFVFLTWWGNRPAVMERYSSKHYRRVEGAMPEFRPGAGADASEVQTGSAEPAGHAVRSPSGMQKRRPKRDSQKITWLG